MPGIFFLSFLLDTYIFVFNLLGKEWNHLNLIFLALSLNNTGVWIFTVIQFLLNNCKSYNPFLEALLRRQWRWWYPAGIYLFKVNNRNSRTMSKILFKVNNGNSRKMGKICWKLTIKTKARCQWRQFNIPRAGFETKRS